MRVYNHTTKEFVDILLDPDMEEQAANHHWYMRIVNKKYIYITTTINGKMMSLAKFVYGDTYPWQRLTLIGDKHDYRRSNIRAVSAGELRHNNRPISTSTTGHRGVTMRGAGGRYRAYIVVNYEQIHLGCFTTLDGAIKARKDAELKYWGVRNENK